MIGYLTSASNIVEEQLIVVAVALINRWTCGIFSCHTNVIHAPHACADGFIVLVVGGDVVNDGGSEDLADKDVLCKTFARI